MKTRLDEIVEEEGRRWVELMRPAPWTGEQVVVAERIAERAFRHGVEQCDHVGTTDINGDDVQPAPSMEKCCDWVDGPHCHEGDRVFKDRRKGERRKGLEVCPHAPEYPGRCFVYTKLGGTVLHAGDSRHKDRRK